MNLLDTHAVVWAIHEPARLSASGRRIIEDADYWVSAASLWEMLLKKNRPDSPVPGDPLAWWRRYVVNGGMRILAMEWPHISHLDTLPLYTKDPFDRILVSQCIAESLRFVTKDSRVRDHYQDHVHCIW